MLCSRCKKKSAIVFISSGKDKCETQGLCAECAKKMGVDPIKDIMNKMGVSEKDISDIQEQFSGIIDANTDGETFLEGTDENNDFSRGGAATFPLIKNLFSNILFPERENPESHNDNEACQKAPKKAKRKNLDLYCNNLTLKAKNEELDRIIGREKEIDRAVQILSRRTKNNPCLIGEPGVGKTAIAEGLALKICKGDVPFRLRDKEIHLLDLTALVAGTQFRGQFESRIRGLIEEVKKDGNVILFIDEVHNLVGAGDSEGSMSAANILKPALSRGEIQVIGATTFDEYRKHIEKDAALERRFQPVKVLEPTPEETVNILKGIRDYYEMHHRVSVPDEIIKSLVTLSERYITDRFLPDKAIDLMDESCTYSALNNKNLARYDKISLKTENLKKEEEKILAAGEEADYEALAKIRCDIAKCNKELEKLSLTALGKPVTSKDIAYVIELWTGIPSAKIQEKEFMKLANLENKLKEKIIGQDEAVKELSAAIMRNRVQISPRRRPVSFIFAGPTGVGKTELVKVLTVELFNSLNALIRLDMSEYMEKHAASKIVGSPPGYVGYEESGQLTEKVRRNPYSVLLLDEIEKAHPDVMNILLQILDEGKITDSHGRNVNFENTVIIMTSNAGSGKNFSSLGFAKNENEISKEKTLKALKEFLKPEFISRIDEIMVFNTLAQKDFEKIAKLMLEEYVESLAEHGIKFSFDESALKLLAEKATEGKSGARNLRNIIRKEVEDKISSEIVKNNGFDIGNIFLSGDENLKISIGNNI